VAESLLLLCQLALDTIEVAHHSVKLFIFTFSCRLQICVVKHAEFLLEFFFSTLFVLISTIKLDEISKFGLLASLSYVEDYSHGNILELVFEHLLIVIHVRNMFRCFDIIITWVLLLHLKNPVLIC